MKIRSLELKGIGVFKDTKIDFPEKKTDGAEIHILTGQNGTGKTTILQALASGMAFTEPFKSDAWYNQHGLSKNKFEYTFFKKLTPNQSKAILNFTNINDKITISKIGTSIAKDSTRILPSYKRDFNITNEENKVLYNEYRQKNGLTFCAFCYSGYRFIEHEENINIADNSEFNPLENALNFNKNEEKHSLNKWLAINISKRALARDKKDNQANKKFDENIKNLEKIINDILHEEENDSKISFEVNYDTGLKVVFVDKKEQELDFDLLPDGLRSIISWLGDLIMRMDALKWENDTPVFEREFILFLDEIEVHLHPYWQRKILPVIQKTFVNAQIFITTHSPFIVNSVDGAWIYELKLDTDGNCEAEKPQLSSSMMPIDEVLQEIYDISPTQMYGEPTKVEIDRFQEELDKAYEKKVDFDKVQFVELARKLASRSEDLRNNVQFELRQLSKSLNEEFEL